MRVGEEEKGEAAVGDFDEPSSDLTDLLYNFV